ncbi:MAG: cysteine desulfurase family protein [Thermomicrobiales bacterium]
MNDDTIYLDHAATTPLLPAVLDAMLPYLSLEYGNPSSIYRAGQDGKSAIERARRQAATAIGCHPSEIVFTSGATESDNLALSGVMWHSRLKNASQPPPHLIVSAVEHHAVLHTAEFLERQGFSLTIVPVDAEGFVDPDAVRAAIRPETRLISIMMANNEIGAVQPIAEIGAVARSAGVIFHTDAVQAAGALAIKVEDLRVDLLSLSAHKFRGPKGVGLLYVRKGTPIEWMQLGGGQESGRRGGTENVAGIVGLGTAIELAEQTRDTHVAHLVQMRDALWRQLQESIDDIDLNGPSDFSRRLPNNLNVAIRGVQGETVLLALDMIGIAASAGSACTTGNSEPSHVLLAMGQSEDRARSSVRFSVGESTTVDEIEEVVDGLQEIVERSRRIAGARL